jgi:hypothetical protein
MRNITEGNHMNAIVTSEVKLPAVGKRLAVQAIEAVHAAYNANGGLKETLQLAETQAVGISRHIYGIAQGAAKRQKKLELAAVEFGALCAYAEASYKTKHSVENLRDVLPVWVVFKSNILRGIRQGLSPLESPNEKAFRTLTMEKIAEKRAVTVDNEEGDESTETDEDESVLRIPTRAGPKPLELIESFVETTSVREPLKMLVANILFSAEHIKPSLVTQAEEVLREAWQKLGSMVSKSALR